LSPSNVGGLTVKWSVTTHGDVSATPAVDADTVYVPDWAGYIYAVNRLNGVVKWTVKLSDVTGVPFDKARATPAVTDDAIIFGTQGSILVPGGAPGGKIVAPVQWRGSLRRTRIPLPSSLRLPLCSMDASTSVSHLKRKRSPPSAFNFWKRNIVSVVILGGFDSHGHNG
jgi:hypothetical protein